MKSVTLALNRKRSTADYESYDLFMEVTEDVQSDESTSEACERVYGEMIKSFTVMNSKILRLCRKLKI